MNLDSCKVPLLNLYYLASLPQRRQAASRMEEELRSPVMVLFYHRVADTHSNGWTIGIERFREQMLWLQERYDLISLPEAQRRIGAGENSRPGVCVTFDDGYSENCETAIPWLLDNHVPFTYFVTTENLRTGEPFSHDVDAGAPLAPNTAEQLREMAAAGVEIGAHTRTHPDLGRIEDKQQLFEEIVGSKRELEQVIDRPVNYFAFPFGLPANMSTQAFEIAYQAGFWGVCSAYGGYNLPGDDSFHLQRIHGDPQWPRFRNWMTIDPRKLKQPRLFNPGDYRAQF